MTIAIHILNFLKDNEKVEIPGFGIFNFKTVGAYLAADQKFLPPTKELVFAADYQNDNRSFIEYIAQQEAISEVEANAELQKHTQQWKNKLAANQELQIKQIGIFENSENGIIFKSEKIEDLSQDFYGLEAIKIPELKRSENVLQQDNHQVDVQKAYQFNKSLLWIFVVALPIILIAYFGITNPEIIFGNKTNFNSTENNKVKETKNDLPKNTVLNDSLKRDSVSVQANPVSTQP